MPEAANAIARLAAVDNSTCFIRIMITPWYVLSKPASCSSIRCGLATSLPVAAVVLARIESSEIRDPPVSSATSPRVSLALNAGLRAAKLFLRVLHVKVPQVRWSLALLGGHEEPVGAAHVGFIAELDVVVVLGADRFDPDRIADAVVVLRNRPRPRQRVVDRGDLVAQNVGLVLVLVEALMDDGFAVRVKRNAA